MITDSLNSFAKVDPVPMLKADDLLSQVPEARFFSKLDLTKEYNQAQKEQASKLSTAFATSEGLYQFKVLPFGLPNSSFTFVHLM